MENYENFFEWLLDCVILTVEFRSITWILFLIILVLVIVKLVISIFQQIKNLFK